MATAGALFRFELQRSDGQGGARRGRLATRRGAIETPAFMPVGSLGTVKGLGPEDVQRLGFGLILNNAYHLSLRPGHEVVASL
jgi:queuine tRNA-ribosyltransferase